MQTKLCLAFLMFLGASLANKYYISTNTATFLQALTFCRRYGMKLITIDSAEKNSDLYQTFLRANEAHVFYWTSGIYTNNTMTDEWYWLESDSPVVYTDWRKIDIPWNGIEPSYYPNTDNCLRWGFYDVAHAPKGAWRVDACTSALRFICERPYSGICKKTYDSSSSRCSC